MKVRNDCYVRDRQGARKLYLFFVLVAQFVMLTFPNFAVVLGFRNNGRNGHHSSVAVTESKDLLTFEKCLLKSLVDITVSWRQLQQRKCLLCSKTLLFRDTDERDWHANALDLVHLRLHLPFSIDTLQFLKSGDYRDDVTRTWCRFLRTPSRVGRKFE